MANRFLSTTFFHCTVAGIHFESLAIVSNKTQHVTTGNVNWLKALRRAETSINIAQRHRQTFSFPVFGTILYAEISELHQTAENNKKSFPSYFFTFIACFKEPKNQEKNSCHIHLHMKAVTQDKATRNTLPSLLRGFVTRLQHAPSLVDLMLLWFDYLKLGFTALKHTSKHMSTYADAVRCW